MSDEKQSEINDELLQEERELLIEECSRIKRENPEKYKNFNWREIASDVWSIEYCEDYKVWEWDWELLKFLQPFVDERLGKSLFTLVV